MMIAAIFYAAVSMLTVAPQYQDGCFSVPIERPCELDIFLATRSVNAPPSSSNVVTTFTLLQYDSTGQPEPPESGTYTAKQEPNTLHFFIAQVAGDTTTPLPDEVGFAIPIDGNKIVVVLHYNGDDALFDITISHCPAAGDDS